MAWSARCCSRCRIGALPRFRAFVPHAACETLFGVPGSTVLLYAALVGTPLAGAILLVVLTARASIASIATRRYPPPGQKVFGRVKVRRGWQAVAFALMPAMVITYLCVLSGQGMLTAATMAREIDRSANCGTAESAQTSQPRESDRRAKGADAGRPAR